MLRMTIALVGAMLALAAAAEGEFAFSYRFRIDPGADTQPVAFGLKHLAHPCLAEAPFEFAVKDKADVVGGKQRNMAVEVECATGGWHHVAFAYSASRGWCRFWFDGKQQQEDRLEASCELDVAALLAQKPPKGFPGEVTAIRTFKTVPTEEQLFAGRIPEAERRAAKAAFEAAAAQDGVQPAFAAWCRAKAAEAAAFGDEGDLGAWHRLETLRRRLPKLLPLARTAADATVLPFVINRYAPIKHVPFAVPEDARPFAGLSIRAARDEWDCESFMIHPFADAKGFFMEPSDLKGPDGATIPGALIDIRVVTCWYQCRGAWNTWFGAGRDMPALCPELLVHDDAFMRVDTDARRNLLRTINSDGIDYVDVSERLHEDVARPFRLNLERVEDAKTFQPLDLREGVMRQFWLTLKVPDGQRPGRYTGSIALTVGGRPAGRLPLTVVVHPFRLPWPAPHYDIDKKMIHAWYHHCAIKNKLADSFAVGGITPGMGFDQAVRRTDAEYRNFVEHGAGNIFCDTYGGRTNEWDLADAEAVLLKRNGAVLDPLLGNVSIPTGFADMGANPPRGVTDFSVEANFDAWSREMAAYSNGWRLAAQKLKETYGHTRVVCYGLDEAGPEVVRREMPFMATANRFGGLTYTTQGRPDEAAFITDYDGCPQSICRETAHGWHASGAILTTYAQTHGGPENPDLWRRRKGLFLWFADFDGQNEYVWYEGAHLWNEFVYGPSSIYKNFCMVQPTSDGVIDTIQWESAREGIDDMRYATLLKRLCRAARASGDKALVRDGRLFDAWLETCDYHKADMEDIRAEIVRRIVSLQEALTRAGVDVASFAPPARPRQDLPLPKPQKMSGDGYASRQMYDYACRAWLEEGTEKALFKALDGFLRRRLVKEAAATLAKIEADAGISPGGKAKARLERGFLGLTPTRHNWAPSASALATARKALDRAVLYDRQRAGEGYLVAMSIRLMRALSAAGDHEGAIEVGERLFESGLKGAIGSRESGMHPNGLAMMIGEEYFTLGRYRQAIRWFDPAARARSYHALMRKGDAARRQKDYVTAMNAYAEAASTIDRKRLGDKYQQVVGLVRQMSEAIRRNTQQSQKSARSSLELDDAAEEISLEEDE